MGIKLHQVQNDASENLRIASGVSPLVDQVVGLCSVEWEVLEVVDGGGVFEDACSDNGQSDREDFRIVILIVVNSS